MDSTRPNTSLTAQGTVPPTSAGGMHMGTGEPMGAGALIKMSVELNTSFNENEPIVNAPIHALECYLRTSMDMLVLGNVIIQRR